MHHDDAAEELQRQAEEFERRGVVVVPNALSPVQVAAMNSAIEGYRAAYPEEWVELSDSLCQTVDVLPRTAEFDCAIENPVTLKLLEQIIGPSVALEEFSIMIRRPTPNLNEYKGWHRDIIRDFNRRMEINAVSLVYYLTDVGPSDHCLSVIPETHHRLVDMQPASVQPGQEFDITGPAGTALLFHARCIHTGKLKAGSRERRTLHIYYGPADLPRTSEWSQIPERLYRKYDPSLPPQLYAKWNVRESVDGTGRKPRDVAPNLSIAEMIRIVQQRAKVGK